MKRCAIKNLSVLPLGAVTLLIATSANALNFKVNETSVDIYGYTKLDVIYDVDADLGNTITRSNVRVDGEAGPDGHTTMHAFESRLGLTTSTEVGGHVLKTNVEGDFYGAGGAFRLRHAYGVWNGLLAGQTWSNFGNVFSYLPTVDFNGSLSHGGFRQAQLRYTTGNFSVSLEDPEVGGALVAEGTNKYRIPDITARYQSSIGPVSFAVAGLARFFEYDAEGAAVGTNSDWTDDSATGWGIMSEARVMVTDAITLRASLTHGDGIGSYIYLSPAQPGYVDQNGKLETIKATGGGLSMSIAVGSGAFNLGYGFVDADLDDAFADGAITSGADERQSSTFANYIWSPVERITYGLEAGYHTTKQVDGADGDALRLQAMVKIGF